MNIQNSSHLKGVSQDNASEAQHNVDQSQRAILSNLVYAIIKPLITALSEVFQICKSIANLHRTPTKNQHLGSQDFDANLEERIQSEIETLHSFSKKLTYTRTQVYQEFDRKVKSACDRLLPEIKKLQKKNQKLTTDAHNLSSQLQSMRERTEADRRSKNREIKDLKDDLLAMTNERDVETIKLDTFKYDYMRRRKPRNRKSMSPHEKVNSYLQGIPLKAKEMSNSDGESKQSSQDADNQNKENRDEN